MKSYWKSFRAYMYSQKFFQEKTVIHIFEVLFFYIFLFVAFFSPILFSNRLLAPGDAFVQSVPAFYAPLKLWSNLLLSGFPVAADPTVQTWYPLARIFSLFHSWNGFVVSAYVLASCFTYGYVYAITGSRLASFISGTIYGMSGFMMAHLGHTSMVHAAAWLPLWLWALEKLRHQLSARWFAVAVFAITNSVLAGHPQITVYSIGLSAAYVFIMGWNTVKRWNYYIFYILALVLGLGLSAIQLLPTAELIELGVRAKLSFTEFVSFSISLKETIVLIFPYIFGGGYNSAYFRPFNLTELTGYIGLLSILLSVVGFVAYRFNSLLWFWAIVIIVVIFLALGDSTPVAKLMYYVPIYNKFRAHARNFIEMALAVSVLAGFGIVAIQRQIVSRQLISKILIICSGMMFCCIAIAILILNSLKSLAVTKGIEPIKLLSLSNPALVVPILVFVMACAALIYWVRRPESKYRQFWLLLVLTIDLGSFGWFYEWKWRAPDKNHIVIPSYAQHYKELLTADNQRMLPIICGAYGALSEIPPNISRLWGVPSVSYYGPFMLKRVSELLSMAPNGAVSGDWGNSNNRSLDLMAIRYVFMPIMKPWKQLHGFDWAKEDLSISLGSGCGISQPDSVKFSLHKPVPATAIGVISSMACSTGVPDKAEVLHVVVTDVSGNIQTVPLHAGRDTSEWAYDCEDVLPLMKHGRASIFESFPVVRESNKPCEGHKYIATLRLNNMSKIKEIELKWVYPLGAIGVQKISLLNEMTGKSHFVTSVDNPQWRYVEDIRGETAVYENLRAMPRAWLVPEVVRLKPDEILRAIKTSQMPDGRTYEPRQIALVEEPFALKINNFDESATSRIIHLDDTSIEIHTNSASPAFLVLSDVYYPGWKAFIDGIPTHVFQTNYAIRGVMVPSGGHIVRFEFRPLSFYIGATISLTSLLLLSSLSLITIIRRRRPSDGK